MIYKFCGMNLACGDDDPEDPSTKYSEANSNTNNLISDQDVNISFDVNEVDEQPSEESKNNSSNQKNDLERETERREWLRGLEEEQSQWDALEEVQYSSTGSVKATSPVVFTEVLHHFQAKSLDSSNIRPTVERTGFAAFLHFLFGSPRLHESLVEERNLIFCIAQNQLDDKEEIHGRVLQTIYKRLTGSKFDCPRRGSHWETIGFQGADPATDLRGVGFLGLMQILHGTTDSDTSSLFTDFYKLSLDEEQNFPFCVMSFNVTKISLQVLREGKLNRDSNKRKQVFAIFNEFYVALFLHIYTIWKTQFKTMKDSGNVIKDAERHALKKTKQLLRNLETTLKERRGNRKNLPVSPVPIAGPLSATHQADLHRKVSAASSLSSYSEKPKDSGTPNSARFVATKKLSTDSLQNFTDIRVEAADNIPTTDL